ncbi:MAG: YtxH domain-containing protein [Chitinophagaceae bacterium]|jgi:gas vesicle protein|nr:MAG: YtxH domain-containing protein [Chitinophagaceae bacterium]
MTTRNKVLLGILGAATAGVVIGLLIAPDKGSETRKKIKNKAGDWADSLSHLWDKGRRMAEDGMDEVREKGRHAKHAAEEKVNKLKENFS